MISRQMCGVHWRIDGQEGLTLGEMVAVRILQQVKTCISDIHERYCSEHVPTAFPVWTMFPHLSLSHEANETNAEQERVNCSNDEIDTW